MKTDDNLSEKKLTLYNRKKMAIILGKIGPSPPQYSKIGIPAKIFFAN